MLKSLLAWIETITGAAAWPVPAGVLAGGAILIGLSLSQPTVPAGTQTAKAETQTAKAESSVALTPGLPSRTNKPVIPTKGQAVPPERSQSLLLPPRPEASDVTRRIEKGLPPRTKAAPVLARLRTPPPPAELRPRIAIVIDDMGFDRKNSTRALRLPPEVTLAYLPYAPAVAAQVRRARLKGHPVILHLPMEAPDHRGKPGVNVLAVSSGTAELRAHLVRMLGRFGGYTGVNNHMGSKFTRDRAKMAIVMAELKKRGLYFLDSRTSGSSVGAVAARDAGIAHATRDVFIDHEADPRKIRARLAQTEEIARKTGQAIAIGHPRNATMDALEPWIAGLEKRGFSLVRLDTLLTRPDPKRLAQLQTAE